MNRLLAGVLALGTFVPTWAAAAQSSGGVPQSAVPRTFDGPPAPLPPSVINRDESGHVTVRAVRVSTPLRIDGRLDERVYADTAAMSDFIQNEPQEGAPATEMTEVWVFFDHTNVYVVGRCWESRPERMIANEMRRDSGNIIQNDVFAWGFDTFYDRRNNVFFEVGAAGGRIDGQVTNERQYNMDWNPIWNVKVGRFEGGWVVEAAVPFKSLRYAPGDAQIWGFNVRRINRWKNEYSSLTRVPASVGTTGHLRASMFATLVGLETPSGSKNLDLKPYVTSSVTSDAIAQPAVSNHPQSDVGLDLKYGVAQSLTADLTYNTDFAQVEADEQQINLTRFNLFFQEKRDFFLENQGVFSFGGALTSGNAAGNSDTPILFYSRQIGLARARPVPIRGGGRLTGRVGGFTVGVLDVQTGDETVSRAGATNFAVLRVKRDVLRKSSVGVIFTRRSASADGVGSNQAYGVDGNFSFFDEIAINTYWASTTSSAGSGRGASYRAHFDYVGDRYGVQAEHLVVGKHFSPGVGFARRLDMRKTFGQFRFSPRPKWPSWVRKAFWIGSVTNVENGAGRLETRTWEGQFETQLQNSDRFIVAYSRNREYVSAPFAIAPAIIVPRGDYDFASARALYTFGKQRSLSGSLSVERGSFYSGDKTTFTVTQSRMTFGPRISVEPNVSINWVNLPEGRLTARLVGSRMNYTMTPLMFASALLQYNVGAHTVAANIRLRWEYQPGSELFVVYNEQRNTLARAFPDLENRAFIVKINRAFRF